MKFFRNNWFWILGILIGVGISSIILGQRNQPQTDETGNMAPDVAAHTPDATKLPPGETEQSGHWHNGVWHKKPHAKLVQTSQKKENPLKFRYTFKKAENGKAKYGKIVPPSSGHLQKPPPLPEDIKTRLIQLAKGMAGSVKNYMETEEYAERELEILTGDLTPEEAVIFLEKHQVYNAAILERISADRGFGYLKAIWASPERTSAAAKRAHAENPDNFDAQMWILGYEDKSKRIAGYREILAKNPNYVRALRSLGRDLAYDAPIEAIQHLKKATSIDPTFGLFYLGKAHERLGEVKTAWLYYRKRQNHPRSVFRDSILNQHMRALEGGGFNYQPIQREREVLLQIDQEVLQPDMGKAHPEKDSLPVVVEKPWHSELTPLKPKTPEKQPTDKELRKAARTEALRAEFLRHQEQAHQEFKVFIEWVESVANENAPIDTNDFLAKELAAHLKGGKTEVAPERLVRAFEFINRYGKEEGHKRLKERDRELATEIESYKNKTTSEKMQD